MKGLGISSRLGCTARVNKAYTLTKYIHSSSFYVRFHIPGPALGYTISPDPSFPARACGYAGARIRLYRRVWVPDYLTPHSLDKKIKMKFFIEEEGKEMYFEGCICSYDGQTGKYGA